MVRQIYAQNGVGAHQLLVKLAQQRLVREVGNVLVVVVRLPGVQVLFVLRVAGVDALEDAQAPKVAEGQLQALDGLCAAHKLGHSAVGAGLEALALLLEQAGARQLAIQFFGATLFTLRIALRVAGLWHGRRRKCAWSGEKLRARKAQKNRDYFGESFPTSPTFDSS